MQSRSHAKKIPHALSWLIRRRAIALGELAAIAARQAKVIGRIRKRANVEIERVNLHYKIALQDCARSLSEIDKVMALHNLQIDPDVIQPRRMYKAPRMLPHGTMTREIVSYLKKAGRRAVTTSEITKHLATHLEYELTKQEFLHLRECTRSSLKTLAKKGPIEAAGFDGNERTSERLWRFVDPWNKPERV